MIVEEILMNLDAPEDRVHTALSRAVFGDHPLGREVLGEMATVEAITRDEIADFFRPLVPPGHDGGHGGRSARARRRSSRRWRRARRRRRRRAARRARRPPLRPSDVIVERDDTEQAHLCLGWRSLSNGDDDRWAMSVANQVLGGGMASRLFQEVREERGLAYSVYSHPTAFEDSGYLTIYCGTAPKRAREALEVIDDVVAVGAGRRHHRGASWPSRPGYLEGSMLLGLEDSGGRMGRLGRSLMQRDRITTIDEHVARLRAVTTADVSPRPPPRARRRPARWPPSGPSRPTSWSASDRVYASHRPWAERRRSCTWGSSTRRRPRSARPPRRPRTASPSRPAKRKADALLRELGAWTYAKHKGGFDEADANIARVLGELAAHEAEHGELGAKEEPATAAPARAAPPPPPAARRRRRRLRRRRRRDAAAAAAATPAARPGAPGRRPPPTAPPAASRALTDAPTTRWPPEPRSRRPLRSLRRPRRRPRRRPLRRAIRCHRPHRRPEP